MKWYQWPLWKQKTTWAGISICAGAVTAAATGALDPQAAVAAFVGGLAMIVTQGASTAQGE